MTIEQELLARYGRHIDLPAYLQSRGYQVDQESSSDSRVLRMADPSGRPITIAKALDGDSGWTYANPADRADHGTICDYLQRHEGLSVPAAINRVASCLDPTRRDVPEAVAYRTAIVHKPEPLRRAEHEHEVLTTTRGAAVRALSRAGLSSQTIDETRLGPINGLNDFTRLTSEPSVGELWASRYKSTDRTLVIGERPLDALGCVQQRRDPRAACLAVGQQLDPAQRKRLAHVLGAVPSGVSVVLAFGNTTRGRQLANEVHALAPMLKMERQPPSLPGRWGEHLQLAKNHEIALAQRGPALAR